MCNSQSDWSLWFWHFDVFQSTQYYDMRWSCEHLIMVWINAFVMLMSQLLPPSYCDLLHRSAAHLGRWQRLEHGSYSNAPQHMWVSRADPSALCKSLWMSRDVSGLLLLCSAGRTAPSGRREFWSDTAAASIRPSGRTTWPCPPTSRTPGFMWVSHPLTQYDVMNAIVNEWNLCCLWVI